jgi:hypothetical protein
MTGMTAAADWKAMATLSRAMKSAARMARRIVAALLRTRIGRERSMLG